jgi:hypothetical protein
MSESFSASRRPAPVYELPLKGAKMAAKPVRPVAAMPLEPSLEQVKAVKGALNFLTALIAFYGELVEQEGLANAEPAQNKGPGPQ